MRRLESSLQAVFRRHAKAWTPTLLASLLLVACSPEQQSVIKSKVANVLPLARTNTAQQAEGNWTPEKISANPAGYLQFAGNKVGAQIAGRKQKLNELASQRADVETRAQALKTKVSDATNIANRMRTAIQRADDENNWPVKMAGRTFDQSKAEEIIKSLQQFGADRQSLVQAYDDALSRISSTEAAIKADIENLEHMREKVGLDLERVRLNQNIAEMGDLHKTENELAAFAKTLADMSDAAAISKIGALPAKSNESVDAESLLR